MLFRTITRIQTINFCCIKKQIIFFFACIFFLASTNRVLSQGNGNNTFSYTNLGESSVAPLSPNAAELFKYTAIPVSLMTGTPSIELPVFTIKSGNLEVPISLSYHASGIKVNQKATWVGLGWNLNVGGMISREVRGLPDETINYANGWFNDNHSIHTYDSVLNDAGTNLNNKFTDYTFLQAVAGGQIMDTHPDFFSYNLPHKSGKFIYSRAQKKFVALPFEPVKIAISSYTGNGTFTITDDDGTQYFFNQLQFYTDSRPVTGYVQSWYLTKILSADQQDFIVFTYSTGNGTSFSPIESFSESYYTCNVVGTYVPGYPASDPDAVCTGSASVGPTHTTNLGRTSLVQLSEITFRGGKVDFYSNGARYDDAGGALDSITVFTSSNAGYTRTKSFSFAHDYFPNSDTSNYLFCRLRLLSFSQNDVTGITQPTTYGFSYNTTAAMPPLNSYAVDYWGYYNGQTNNGSLLPGIVPNLPGIMQQVGFANRNPDTAAMQIGLLKTINYPTGGSSQFSFESDKYISNVITNYQRSVTAATASVYGNPANPKFPNTQKVAFNLPSNLYSTLGDISISFYPYPSVAPAQEVDIFDVTTNQQITFWKNTGDPSVTHTVNATLGFDSTHTYQLVVIGANTAGTLTATASVSFTQLVVDSSRIVKYGGGLHIASISNYDNNGQLKGKTLYKYGVNEDGIGRSILSDGVIANSYTKQDFRVLKLDDFGTVSPKWGGSLATYTASNVYQNLSYQGAVVLYDRATQYDVDSTGIPSGKTISQFNLPNDYIQIPNSNIPGGNEWIDNSLYDVQMASQKRYRYNSGAGTYSLLQADNYGYSKYGLSSEPMALWTKEVQFLPSSLVPNPVESSDFINDIHCRYYDLNVGAYRKIAWTHQEFDDNGDTLSSQTFYRYNNNAHLYPSFVIALNSKGDSLINQFNYPGDHLSTDSNASVLNQMVAENILKRPYFRGDFKNALFLQSLRTKFQSGWNNNATAIYPINDALVSQYSGTPVTEKVINYNNYDNYGNIHERQKINDVKEVYLWSYNNQYPVAKIVGSDYATVNGIVNQLQIDAATAIPNNDQNVRNLLNGIRDYFKSNPLVQVSTYTYAPLVGVTSETDPKGYATYYEYDGFGRLIDAKDKDGNVIKKYNYHYQGQ